MIGRERLLNAATGAVALCTIVTTGLVLRREIAPPRSQASVGPLEPPRKVDDWQKYANVGHRLGSSTAALTLVEFADFECPACRGFHTTITTLKKKYPGQVSVVYRHFPLPSHRFAAPSARAADCAAAQGRFEQYHDLLFEKQDSLGLIAFRELANTAGVTDLKTFDICQAHSAPTKGFEEDTKAVAELNLTGTPSILVNGQLYTGAPSASDLERMILAARTKQASRP